LAVPSAKFVARPCEPALWRSWHGGRGGLPRDWSVNVRGELSVRCGGDELLLRPWRPTDSPASNAIDFGAAAVTVRVSVGPGDPFRLAVMFWWCQRGVVGKSARPARVGKWATRAWRNAQGLEWYVEVSCREGAVGDELLRETLGYRRIPPASKRDRLSGAQ